VQVVVDNSAGGDPQFAAHVARGLRERGLEVEERAPHSGSIFDTAVHLLSAGMVIRVPHAPERAERDAIAEAVREALRHRSSLRRRTRTVPVHLGESRRVLEWIDLFDT